MSGLGEYIAPRDGAESSGEASTDVSGVSDVSVISRRELNRLIERYEWFTTARRARALITGDPDPALALPLMFWPTERPVLRRPQPGTPPAEPAVAVVGTEASADLIDRFIEHGGYRIVPDDDAGAEAEGMAETETDIDPEMVTEELAEIYRAQGLDAEADEIYRILNLRNS